MNLGRMTDNLDVVGTPAGPQGVDRRLIVVNDDTGSKVWDYAFSRESYVVQSFALAVTGIGALFFAYGEVGNQHLRIVVSAIGLGASIVILLHSWTSLKDRNSAIDVLGDPATGGTNLIAAYRKIAGWRNEWPYSIMAIPVTAAATCFSWLVSVIWALILITDLRYLWYRVAMPWWWDEVAVILAVTAGSSYLISVKLEGRRRAQGLKPANLYDPPIFGLTATLILIAVVSAIIWNLK